MTTRPGLFQIMPTFHRFWIDRRTELRDGSGFARRIESRSAKSRTLDPRPTQSEPRRCEHPAVVKELFAAGRESRTLFRCCHGSGQRGRCHDAGMTRCCVAKNLRSSSRMDHFPGCEAFLCVPYEVLDRYFCWPLWSSCLHGPDVPSPQMAPATRAQIRSRSRRCSTIHRSTTTRR